MRVNLLLQLSIIDVVGGELEEEDDELGVSAGTSGASLATTAGTSKPSSFNLSGVVAGAGVGSNGPSGTGAGGGGWPSVSLRTFLVCMTSAIRQ